MTGFSYHRYTCPGCGEPVRPEQRRRNHGMSFTLHLGCTATCDLCGEEVTHRPFGGADVAAWLGRPVHPACKKAVQEEMSS